MAYGGFRRQAAMSAAAMAVTVAAGVGATATPSSAATAVAAQPASATVNTALRARVPADVVAAVAAAPTDVLVTVDDRAALRQLRLRSGRTRATRRAAAAEAATTFAGTKRRLLHGRPGVRPARDFAQLPVQLVRVDSPAALRALAGTAGVTSVSLPVRRTLDATANLSLIRQPDASANGNTGAGTRVAVLDTGVDYTLPGASATFGDCSGGPATGSCRIKAHVDVAATGMRDVHAGYHGTNVSGVVATVAPAADLAVYNVFKDLGGGSVGAYDSDILTALNLVAASAAATNTRAVNLSLGDGSHHTTACTNSNYVSAFATLRALGVIPVVAAGNAAHSSGGVFQSGVSDPACVPGAVAVGAAYSQAAGGPFGYGAMCSDSAVVPGQPACFSQTGPVLSVVAPGVAISAAGITQSGTSQAAPHVAAGAAVVAAAHPTANAASITAALLSSGPLVTDSRTSPATVVRRLDLVAAVSAIASNGSPSTSTAPDAPVAVAAAAGNAAATVTWQSGPSDGGSPVTQYTAVASPGGASCSTTGATSCTVGGLTNGSAYTFTVVAQSNRGSSPASSASAAVVPLTVPGAPTGVAAAAGSGAVTVTWAAPADTGGSVVTGYTVVAAPGGATCTTVDTTYCTVGGLTNGTAYTFTGVASNAIGTGPASWPSAAVVPSSVPGPQSAPAVVRGSGQVTVSWAGPADNGGSTVTSYTAVAAPGGLSCTTTANTCVVKRLTNGTAYRFTVTATNGLGSGAASPPSAVVVPAGAPAPVVRVGAVRGHRRAVVSWRAPATGGSRITGYRVVALPGGRACATTGATTCTVTGLVNGRTYRFTVTARNAIGFGIRSVPSAAVVPAPVPAAPGRIAVTRTAQRATVAWVAPAPNGTASIRGYRVIASPGGRSCSTSARVRRCTVTGLRAGQRYNFSVVAINRVGPGMLLSMTAPPVTSLPPGRLTR